MNQLRGLVIIVFFGILCWTSIHLPERGSIAAPAHQTTGDAGAPSPGTFYTLNAYEQTYTKNTVTAVLADYRAFDTLGECLVVFVAGVAVALILSRRREEK